MVLVVWVVGAVEEQRRWSIAEPIWLDRLGRGNGRVNSGLEGVELHRLDTVNHQGRR